MSVVDRFFELVFTNYSGQVLTKLAGDKFEQDIERSGSENARCSPITLSTLVDISGEVPERSFVTVYLYDKGLNGIPVYKGIVVAYEKIQNNTKDNRWNKYTIEIVHIGALLDQLLAVNLGSFTNTAQKITFIQNKLDTTYPGLFFFDYSDTTDGYDLRSSNRTIKEQIQAICDVRNMNWSVGPTGTIVLYRKTTLKTGEIINEGTEVSQIKIKNDKYVFYNRIYFVIEYAVFGSGPTVFIPKNYVKEDTLSVSAVGPLEINLGNIGGNASEALADARADQFANEYFLQQNLVNQQIEITLHPDYFIYDLQVGDTFTLTNSQHSLHNIYITNIEYKITGGIINTGQITTAQQILAG